MSQNFPAIPSTTLISDSLQLLIDRDAAAASNFSGTAFPTANLIVGMMCHRTDLQKIYILRSTGPDVWSFMADVGATDTVAAKATTLNTGRNFVIAGDGTSNTVSFNGSAAVTLTLTLAASGVTAGTYSKVTVDAKGRVTVGAALASADLPQSPTLTGTITGQTLRATATTAVTLGGSGHGLQAGADAGNNVAISAAMVQARNNGAAATLSVNTLGGNVTIGGGSSIVTISGTIGGSVISTTLENQARTAVNKIVTPKGVDEAVLPMLAPVIASGTTSAAASGAYCPLTALDRNVLTGASLASNLVTLPAGTYYIRARTNVRRSSSGTVNQATATLKNVTDAVTLDSNGARGADVGIGGPITLDAVVTIAAPKTFGIVFDRDNSDWQNAGVSATRNTVFEAWRLA